MAKLFKKAGDYLTDLFGSGRKKLERISLDELEHERVRIGKQKEALIDEVEKIEERKEKLFRQGMDASTQRRRTYLAQQYKEKEFEGKRLDDELAVLSNKMILVTALVQIKKDRAFYEEEGLWKLLGEMSLTEVQKYVEDATVEREFQKEKFTQIIRSVEGAKQAEVAQEDRDVAAIAKAMGEAKTAEEGGKEDAATEVMRKMEQVLHEEREEEPEM
jgi:hypothetical protein